jgi:hypothetical protein
MDNLEELFGDVLFELPCCYAVDFYVYLLGGDELYAHAVFGVMVSHDDSELYELDFWLDYLLTLPDEIIADEFERRIRETANLFEDLS